MCKYKNCIYRVRSSGGDKKGVCDYIGYSGGHSRGCSPEECNKYIPENSKKKKRHILISHDPDNILAYRDYGELNINDYLEV